MIADEMYRLAVAEHERIREVHDRARVARVLQARSDERHAASPAAREPQVAVAALSVVGTRPRYGGYLAVVWLVVVPSVLVAVAMASLYFVVLPTMPFLRGYYFNQQEQIYATYVAPLLGHIGFGAIALVLGPVNLVNALRHGYRRPHRWTGGVYTVAVAASATCAIFMSFHAYPGTIPFGRRIVTSGFCLLGLTWLFTIAMALRGILIKRDIAAHRFWIITNLSLTFAAVVIRGENGPILAASQFSRLYPYLAWVSWVPCFIVGVLLARRVNRSRSINEHVHVIRGAEGNAPDPSAAVGGARRG